MPIWLYIYGRIDGWIALISTPSPISRVVVAHTFRISSDYFSTYASLYWPRLMIILRWRFIAIIVERDVFEACYNNMYNDIYKYNLHGIKHMYRNNTFIWTKWITVNIISVRSNNVKHCRIYISILNSGKFILSIASVFRLVEHARAYTCEVIYIRFRCINIVCVEHVPIPIHYLF